MCKAVLNITVYISLNYPSCKMNTDLEVSPGQKEEVFIYLFTKYKTLMYTILS